MRRKDREITDPAVVARIMDRCEILRIGLLDGDCPYIVPLNFAYTFTDGQFAFYVYGACAGRKYELMRRNGRCSFEMDVPLGMAVTEDKQNVTERYMSVMGTARIEFLEDAEKQWAMENVLLARRELTRGFSYDRSALSRCAVAKLAVLEWTARANLPV